MSSAAPVGYQSVFAPGLFNSRVIVVTGGGSGIGRCTAHELAHLGAHVVLVGRKSEKLQTVADEITTDGGAVSWHACDVRSEDAVTLLVQQVLAAHGHIHGLVNNAGGQFMSPLESISAKGWEAVLHTNLTGGFLMARECYRQWMTSNGGSVVNIVADMWGSMPGMGHSGAARAGMVSLTETAALEWACSGVRVNAVAPGYIASSGMDNYPPAAADMLRAMPQTVPLGRFGNEAEVSAAIAFLLSPAASFISGTTLRVDGARPQVRLGWPMRVPDAATQQRAAVKPYGGFHRAQVPRVFASAKPTRAAPKESQ
ncbi:MAG: SDR family oxidoreductase [Acidovorax sp.]|nr:SDR family oxidoreductase [Acidovorax sp.]